MQDRPEGISERELERALTQGWDIHPATLTYAPVGAGSYHWVVADARGGRWFVTVDDLDHKSWLGSTRRAVLAGLRQALDIALALRDQAGPGFVAAPVPGRAGETVWPVNKKYAVAVYPNPGNLMVTDRGPLLVDWDTVGLARPERDLWWVLGGPRDPGDTGDEGRRYTEATGRAINPDAVTFYRIRWTLDDLAAFTQQLRAEHGRTPDAAGAWQALKDTVADAAREAAAREADGSR